MEEEVKKLSKESYTKEELVGYNAQYSLELATFLCEKHPELCTTTIVEIYEFHKEWVKRNS